MSDKVATATAYTSSVATVAAGALSLNEMVMVGGFLIAFATFVYNVWYKERVLREIRKKQVVDIIKETGE